MMMTNGLVLCADLMMSSDESDIMMIMEETKIYFHTHTHTERWNE